MITAHKDTICTGCGDGIKIGNKITVKTIGKHTDILCFRCSPEEVKTVKVTVSPVAGKELKKSYKKQNFFVKRK